MSQAYLLTSVILLPAFLVGCFSKPIELAWYVIGFLALGILIPATATFLPKDPNSHLLVGGAFSGLLLLLTLCCPSAIPGILVLAPLVGVLLYSHLVLRG